MPISVISYDFQTDYSIQLVACQMEYRNFISQGNFLQHYSMEEPLK